MALQMTCIYKGLTATDAYFKIVEAGTKETGISERGVKQYEGILKVSCYTNDTKEFHLEDRTHSFPGLTESDFTYDTAYSCLKRLPEFEGCIDV